MIGCGQSDFCSAGLIGGRGDLAILANLNSVVVRRPNDARIHSVGRSKVIGELNTLGGVGLIDRNLYRNELRSCFAVAVNIELLHVDIRLKSVKSIVKSERCGVDFLLRVFCTCLNLFCVLISCRIFRTGFICMLLNVNLSFIGSCDSGTKCCFVAADSYKAGGLNTAVARCGCNGCLTCINVGKLTVFIDRYNVRVVGDPDNILNRCVVGDYRADVLTFCTELYRLGFKRSVDL